LFGSQTVISPPYRDDIGPDGSRYIRPDIRSQVWQSDAYITGSPFRRGAGGAGVTLAAGLGRRRAECGVAGRESAIVSEIEHLRTLGRLRALIAGGYEARII
jgi:hypothetical protein